MRWHNSGSRVSSNKGVSLIEVMVSVAILGVVSAGMMSLVNQQMKAVGFIEDKVSKESLKGVLLMMLSDTEICETSFAGTTISATGVNVVIKDKAGNPKFDTSAGPVAYEKNEIESIVLKGDPAVIAASTSGLMSLEVVVNRTRTGGGPSTFKAIELPVYVSTDAGNLVSRCGADPAALAASRTWVNMTAARAQLTQYTNDSSSELLLSVSTSIGAGAFAAGIPINGCALAVIVDGAPVFGTHNFNQNWAKACGTTVPVPAGSTYQVNCDVAYNTFNYGCTVSRWFEYRAP